MATASDSLVWELVKKNNCFLIKQFGNNNAKVQFSKEPNNLYNVHSYKYSGLANKKTVTVQPAADKEMTVVLSTTKTKKQNNPAAFSHKTVMRKEFRKMAKAVKNPIAILCLFYVESWYHVLIKYPIWQLVLEINKYVDELLM
ncbi:hypothetical protein ACQ4PT_063676 [Festuca glaucescens]